MLLPYGKLDKLNLRILCVVGKCLHDIGILIYHLTLFRQNRKQGTLQNDREQNYAENYMEHVVFRIAVTHRRHNSKYDRCRPRSPAHDTTRYCRNGVLNGARSKPTAAGLATKVRNRAIAKAGRRIEGICEGNASSPKRKKIRICIRPVNASKKLTSVFWFFRV